MSVAQLLHRQTRALLFTLTVFLLVAVVVAVNATAFGAIHALRWEALPYASEGLAWLRVDLRKIDTKTGLGEHLRERVDRDRAHFAATAGFAMPQRARIDESGRNWRIASVTRSLDALLGVAPALGRGVNADDAHAGADNVLVISDAVWHARFNADPDIVGRSIRFADHTDTVIGVMPPGFAFPDTSIDAWRPWVAPVTASPGEDIGMLEVVARLTGNTSMAQARQALDVLIDGKSLPGIFANLDAGAAIEPWRDHFFADHDQALLLLQIAALVLLLAVAANLVNLQLDRLLGRAREFDIRRALGAGERAIVGTAISDTLPPVVAGLLVGLVLAVPGMRLLQRRGLLPDGLPINPHFNAAVLACGVAIVLVLLAIAALATRLSRGRNGLSAHSGAGGLGRLRPALLVGQIMLTTALLGGAGLLLRSALNVVNVDPGFNANGVLMTSIDLVSNSGQRMEFDQHGDTTLAAKIDDLRNRAETLPGVHQVALANISPFSGGEAVELVNVPGQSQPQQVRVRMITPDYFRALGIGLVNGREFASADIRDSGYPVIVDTLYARRYLGNSNPLSASVGTGSNDGMTGFSQSPIVGVVHAAKQSSLDETADMPTMYVPSHVHFPMFILLVRGSADPASLVEPMRRLIQQQMPDAAIAFNQPLAQRVEHTLGDRRALVESVGGFAFIAMLLAAIGLSAVLSFAIRRRTNELGVRMALGATSSRIRTLVLRQGGLLIVTGLLLGLVFGIALSRLLAERLFGITFTDPLTWSTAALLVTVIALIACWLPARRAAAVDPIEALRHE